ncbi:MAG: hypothetical protein ABIK90_03475, partial [candidate division WOR-3 bacterium]
MLPYSPNMKISIKNFKENFLPQLSTIDAKAREKLVDEVFLLVAICEGSLDIAIYNLEPQQAEEAIQKILPVINFLRKEYGEIINRPLVAKATIPSPLEGKIIIEHPPQLDLPMYQQFGFVWDDEKKSYCRAEEGEIPPFAEKFVQN